MRIGRLEVDIQLIPLLPGEARAAIVKPEHGDLPCWAAWAGPIRLFVERVSTARTTSKRLL